MKPAKQEPPPITRAQYDQVRHQWAESMRSLHDEIKTNVIGSAMSASSLAAQLQEEVRRIVSRLHGFLYTLPDAADDIDPCPPVAPEEKSETNLYLVLFDGTHYYVEAKDFPTAIEAWKKHVMIEWGESYDGTEQPESVALVHDEPVIR